MQWVMSLSACSNNFRVAIANPDLTRRVWVGGLKLTENGLVQVPSHQRIAPRRLELGGRKTGCDADSRAQPRCLRDGWRVGSTGSTIGPATKSKPTVREFVERLNPPGALGSARRGGVWEGDS